jgi:hypothetical protein
MSLPRETSPRRLSPPAYALKLSSLPRAGNSEILNEAPGEADKKGGPERPARTSAAYPLSKEACNTASAAPPRPCDQLAMLT